MKLANKNVCTGCGACELVCNYNAIHMKKDIFGFQYPVIDEERCCNCEICFKMCPVLNNKQRSSIYPPISYMVSVKDKRILDISSSGGAFTLLADWVINKKGYVYGAAFTDNFEVEHCEVNDRDNLVRLCGSKYVQSSQKKIYKDVHKRLNEGRYVLYSGTGCQIAGLKKYLSQEYEKLICADVICFGVGSPKIWTNYLDIFHDHKNIRNIWFRSKDFGWGNNIMKIESNTDLYCRDADKDEYYRGFFSTCFLRESCFSCKFRGMNRYSDFTLGDAWGLASDEKGCSVLMINSCKAEKVWSDINKESCNIYKKIEYVDIVKHNERLERSPTKTILRDLFIKDYTQRSFCYVMKKWFSSVWTYKILRRVNIIFARVWKAK